MNCRWQIVRVCDKAFQTHETSRAFEIQPDILWRWRVGCKTHSDICSVCFFHILYSVSMGRVSDRVMYIAHITRCLSPWLMAYHLHWHALFQGYNLWCTVYCYTQQCNIVVKAYYFTSRKNWFTKTNNVF